MNRLLRMRGWAYWPLFVATTILLVSSCTTVKRPQAAPLKTISSSTKTSVRDVRVLLADSVPGLRVRVDGPYVVRNPDHAQLLSGPSLGVTEISVLAGGGLRMGSHTFPAAVIEIVPERRGDLYWGYDTGKGWSATSRTVGKLRITTETSGRLRVVNSVDLETYLVGVLVGELYSSFHPEAFRAAAVAARTYAMVEMSKKARESYDVTATEASQVYLGVPSGPAAKTALDAVTSTHGVICTWQSPHGRRVFPTFYSSACGGVTQAASNVKPEVNVPPLAGGVRCDYCKIAKGEAYRWNPVKLSKRDIFSRVVKSYPETSALRSLLRLDVLTRTATGRPVRLRLVGENGQGREMLAEDFRLAVGSRVMRSTDCTITDNGESLLFSEGKGFGHGMGLCQWGMQGQAMAGRTADQILTFYYPGAQLTRAY